jgi:hypothetical protein
MHGELQQQQLVRGLPSVYNIITNEPPHYLLFATAATLLMTGDGGGMMAVRSL